MNFEQQEVYVKVPLSRVGVIIGKNGETKKEIEELTNAKIDIDSKSGEISLIRDKAEAFTFYRLESVIKAIGRGFSPMHAKLLFDANYNLDIIDLKEAGISSDKRMITKKGRVIGANGTMKNFIEEAFDCNIALQGKTIALICKTEYIDLAKDAIDSLISGQNIPAVKKQIQRNLSKVLNKGDFE